MKIDPNAPAFPVPMVPCDNAGGFTDVREGGLTVRAHFASLVMQGLMACPETAGKAMEFAAWSVEHADALIAELNKEPAAPAKCQHDWQPSPTTIDPAGTICSKCGERAPF